MCRDGYARSQAAGRACRKHLQFVKITWAAPLDCILGLCWCIGGAHLKLVSVRIRNYRSLVDSGDVEIQGGVTVLIGKNEKGKTNFLKAIASFNDSSKYSPGDLPNHLRPSLEERPPQEIPVTMLRFLLEPEDQGVLSHLLQDAASATEITCTKFYGNSYLFTVKRKDGQEAPLLYRAPDVGKYVEEIRGVARKLKGQLEAHAQRVSGFAPSIETAATLIDGFIATEFVQPSQIDDSIKTFATALTGLAGQDAAIQEDITRATKAIEEQKAIILDAFQKDPELALRQALPRFVFHSTKTDHIPNEVNIIAFVADPEGTSKGMSNLCRAAGLATHRIQSLAQSTDTGQREAYEDHYKGTISGGLNEFWTQEQYHVHFRIERDKLSVSISDETYSPRIAPSDRSEGFHWYLSFYAAILNDMGAARQTVLLLDNPGLELHVDGQRDIKRFLEEKISVNSQVIYVTHSPAMISPYNLEQLRIVEMFANQEGTKVRAYAPKEGEDLLEPVRSAIGMSLVSSLMFNEWNVLVEGAADKPILEGSISVHRPDMSKRVLVSGSVSETSGGFLPRFYVQARLPLVVFLDADSAGRRLYEDLKTRGIDDAKILKLETVVDSQGRDVALEDVLNREFYHRAVVETYPNNPVDVPTDEGKKIANLYEEAFKARYGIGFSKRRTAQTVKKLLEEGKADPVTLEKLKAVIDALLQKLEAQSR